MAYWGKVSRGVVVLAPEADLLERFPVRVEAVIPKPLSFDQSFDCFPATFRSDDNAGIEDQSHGSGLSGWRWLLMTSSRSRAKSLSSVAVEPCFRATRSDFESNRTRGLAG